MSAEAARRIERESIVTPEVFSSDIEEVLVTPEAIRERVAELGHQISADYAGKLPLLVGILRGAFVFLADLARAITIPLEFDFIAVSSYGATTRASGVVRFLKDLEEDIQGRHVILVEDILDTGLTLQFLTNSLQARRPASLEVCALVAKEAAQRVPVKLKYLGFSVPDKWIVGYGLDCGQRYRNLACIAALKRDVYSDLV